MQPQIIIEQKLTAFVNKYSIYQANQEGAKGDLIAFAQQKRLTRKEKFSFYKDTSKQELLFTFRAEKVLDTHGKYFVEDASGTLLGAFKKNFTQSLINSTWHIIDSKQQTILTTYESNKTLAVLRRYLGFIPVVGDIAELILMLFRYHFVFANSDGQVVGRYQKTTLMRDKYMLSFDKTAYENSDWRVLVSMSVALDALQSR